MIVEDELAMRELLVMALDARGFDVVATGSAHEALAILKSQPVDLLLSDLRLGEESAIDLLKELRKLPNGRRLPVILLTGYSDRNAVLAVAQLGVQGYLLKSQLSRNDLVNRIEQQLKGPELNPQTPIQSLTTEQPRSGEMPPTFEVQASQTSGLAEPHLEGVGQRPVAAAAAVEPVADSNAVVTTEAPVSLAPVDLLRALKPIITREQILKQVDKYGEMKALSPTVSQLLSITSNSECSPGQVARIIKRDQAISLKVLKIANSVAYSRGGSVDSIQQALSRIGLSQIRQMALNISVMDNFHLSALGDEFNSELFWEHSIATGLIAAAITRIRKGDERAIDSAFTSGLLHDVARMVFAEQLGEMYRRVLDTAVRLQLPLEQVESRMLLLNHANVMDRVLNAWKFPKSLIEPIAMHHLSAGSIRNLSPQIIAEAATLALANRLAHVMLLGSSGNDCYYPTDEFVQILDLESAAFRFIEEQIPEQTTDLKYAMIQSRPGDARPSYQQLVMKRLKRSIWPLYVSANPEVDGYRLLFERLRECDRHQEPNVAVLHLANPRNREALFRSLREQEKIAGIAALPLIIISPSMAIEVEQRLLAGRMHEVLPSPFTLSRLANTISKLLPPEPE